MGTFRGSRNMSSRPQAGLEVLLDQVAHGDRAAFRSLYDAAAPALLGVCLRILRSREVAEDALQEACFRIWSKAHLYDRTKGTAMAWMATIARRCALDKIAARRGPGATLEELNDDMASIVGGADSADVAGLKRCLEKLDPRFTWPIMLAYFYGLTHEEIAGKLGEPLGTVKSRISRGLGHLKDCLD
jgi:RNA polymerase sigma-70 factor (ECF subfamily)